MASLKLKLMLTYRTFVTQTQLSRHFFRLCRKTHSVKFCVCFKTYQQQWFYILEGDTGLSNRLQNQHDAETWWNHGQISKNARLQERHSAFLSPSFRSSVFRSLLICVPEETYEVMSSQMGGEPRVQTGGSKNVKAHCEGEGEILIGVCDKWSINTVKQIAADWASLINVVLILPWI